MNWLLLFLFAACFSLATYLHTWYLGWQGNRSDSPNLFAVAMGDSRRMFANHFFAKADVYFHRGFYPSIFDNRGKFEAAHAERNMGAEHATRDDGEEHHDAQGCEHHDHEHCNHAHRDHGHHDPDFLGQPRDWIEWMNRHFAPSKHTELTDAGPDNGKGLEREILPWLWLSAELDPLRVETYTVASFWLSERLGEADEAEKFLRQGLRENPRSFEILYELGRLHYVHRHDLSLTRNLWELGLRRWHQQEDAKPKADNDYLARFHRGLARVEEADGNLSAAITHLEQLKGVSPLPKIIQGQIDELKAKIAAQAPLASKAASPAPAPSAN